MIGIRNPVPWNAGIHIMESRIQDCLAFPYMGRPQGDSMYNPRGVGLLPTMAYFRRCPFHSSGILLHKGYGNLSFFFVCKMHFMAVKKVRKCSGFVIY